MKIQVSIPDAVLWQIDTRASYTGMTRAELIRAALADAYFPRGVPSGVPEDTARTPPRYPHGISTDTLPQIIPESIPSGVPEDTARLPPGMLPRARAPSPKGKGGEGGEGDVREETKKTKFPKLWTPTQPEKDYWAKHVSWKSCREGFEAFRDHHLKNGSRFADWSAAWRTWTRKEVEYHTKSKGNGSREMAI